MSLSELLRIIMLFILRLSEFFAVHKYNFHESRKLSDYQFTMSNRDIHRVTIVRFSIYIRI